MSGNNNNNNNSEENYNNDRNAGAVENAVQAQNEEEEELKDPQEWLKANCSKPGKCGYLKDLLLKCNERVNSRERTRETCEQELYDFVGCVDHCVVKKNLFAFLK